MDKGDASMKKSFAVRVVVLEIWVMLVLPGEALFHRDFSFL